MFKVRLLLLTLLIGCGPVALPASELDPGATFAAHQVHNGFFIERIGGSGYSVLSRNAQTLLDVRGTYRAEILDANDRRVGWWGVHIAEPFEPRLFEGVVPGVSLAMEAGVTLALNSEIDWIEDHTLDVYRGTSSGRLRERSGGGR